MLEAIKNAKREIIPTSSLQAIPLQVEHELLAELAETTIGGVKFGEVDLAGLA